MSRRIAVAAVIGVGLWIVGFSGQASSAPPQNQGGGKRRAPEGQVLTVVEAGNRFAFDLYQRLRPKTGI